MWVHLHLTWMGKCAQVFDWYMSFVLPCVLISSEITINNMEKMYKIGLLSSSKSYLHDALLRSCLFFKYILQSDQGLESSDVIRSERQNLLSMSCKMKLKSYDACHVVWSNNYIISTSSRILSDMRGCATSWWESRSFCTGITFHGFWLMKETLKQTKELPPAAIWDSLCVKLPKQLKAVIGNVL